MAATSLALTACDGGAPADAESEAADAEAAEAGTPNETGDAADQPLPPEPVEMAETAWSSNDADGAVYTTFIDPNGTYRDFRDGRRSQIGSWDMPTGNSICYRPDNAPQGTGEGGDGRTCWTVRQPGRDGVMTAIDADGREVVVRKVKYVAPAAAPAASPAEPPA